MTHSFSLSRICTSSFISILALQPSAAFSQSATIDRVGCGSGCVQVIKQIGPVSRTTSGYPRVPVSVTTIIQPGPGMPLLGYTKTGDPMVNWRGIAYPIIENSWVIADCKGKRVGLNSKDSDGSDVSWTNAFTEDGQPNNCHSACGRSYDQWRLLCSAANLIK